MRSCMGWLEGLVNMNIRCYNVWVLHYSHIFLFLNVNVNV